VHEGPPLLTISVAEDILDSLLAEFVSQFPGAPGEASGFFAECACAQ